MRKTASTAVSVHPLLAERWSPRGFDRAHEIGDEALSALLEAARWAPSAGNSQPWRFLVTRRGEPAHDRLFTALAPGNQAWAERTPPGFTFNIKAFSLFTQHPTPIRAFPADLREAAGSAGKDRVYLKDVDPAVAEAAWDRFLAALGPLRDAGKLGAILLQFPPWFPIGRARREYILSCAQRAAPDRVCVEFRNRTWMTEDNQRETLDFLASHQLPYVCVDMPQGYPSSIPPVLAATSDLAVVRMHGHSDKWTSKEISEKFGYKYSEAELDDWAGRVRDLSGQAEVTHVLFNNCYRDWAHVNAQQLTARLAAPAPGA